MKKGTVLITGSNRGIGLKLAELYAADLWHVIATSRTQIPMGALAKIATSYPETFETMQLDVVQDSSIARLKKDIGNRPINLLINNAGSYRSKNVAFEEIDQNTWLAEMRVNTVAPFMITRAILDNLRCAKKSSVAMLSSLMGSITENNSGGSYAYRSSKAGLNSVVKSLHNELSKHGIKVVALHPGWVQTDMGGTRAPVDVDASAHGLKQVLDNLKTHNSGNFFDYRGKPIHW